MPPPLSTSARIPILQEMHIAEARRAVLLMAAELGLSRTSAYHVATAVSELATNILIHASAGEIRLQAMVQADRVGIEVIAHDHGPGIADVKLALRDGFSTVGSLGCGLPGARRLMDEMEIHSEVGQGTRILARKWAARVKLETPALKPHREGNFRQPVNPGEFNT